MSLGYTRTTNRDFPFDGDMNDHDYECSYCGYVIKADVFNTPYKCKECNAIDYPYRKKVKNKMVKVA